MNEEFKAFPKIPRLENEKMFVTEKIDGTNAQITIKEGKLVSVGSRNRFIKPGDDNYGFAKWANENESELVKLGDGTFYGEWWGLGIGRGYDQPGKRFSLFVYRGELLTDVVDVVPLLSEGKFDLTEIERVCEDLKQNGSKIAPGFMRPEGVVVYLALSKTLYKVPFDKEAKQ